MSSSETERRAREAIDAAYACDREGREADAIVHYDEAWALGVPADAKADFTIGYGSTLRNVGRLRDSATVLREAVSLDPGMPSASFLALTLVSMGRGEAALKTLFDASLALPDDRYRRALSHYRDELAERAAARRPAVTVRYCPRCRWTARASWLAQELLTTFAEEIEVTLSPGPSGTFEVLLDGELVFSRASAGRFPEPKELKQAIRDRAFPGRALGHSDG